ncbi:MAG TPA: peptide ABC transporter substrate-binding protein [Candidatus Binatia bacterium]|nr:peptide ABC transporter substrate-binding protein [Candidatus Binatia bacterium]
MTLAVVGCSKVGNGVAGERHPWTHPGVLRVAVQSDLKNLNPLLNSNTTDVFVDRLMFEPLLTADPKGNPLPMLAVQVPTLENGGISRDGMTITYHLRRNARWTDGVAVTAADVKWSWQAIMNPDNNVVSRHGYDYIASIDTPDAYTATVHLKRPFSPFVNTFFAESDQPYMLGPAHVLAQYPNINNLPFNSRPIVSDGPFKFAQWARGDHITVVRNDKFFMGRPGLNQIEIKIVPDEDTSVNLLRTHGIDYMFQASQQTYQSVRGMPDTKIVWVNVNGYESIQLNCSHPDLQDPRVRLAIAYALDKVEFVRTLTYDTQTVATEDIPDWMWAYNPALRPYPHDPAMARRLLREAGWFPGPDGVMRKGSERLVLVVVSNNSNATRRRMSVEMQAMLREVGIDTEIKYYPGDVLFAPAGMGGILQLGKFDISVAGWYAGIDPDDSTQLMCENLPPGGYNYSRYCSPEMQRLQRIALTRYDRPSRQAAYFAIQEQLAKDNPLIFFYWLKQMEPISVDFKGFDPNPVVEAWNAWQWTI